jgi:hypothetical protein
MQNRYWRRQSWGLLRDEAEFFAAIHFAQDPSKLLRAPYWERPMLHKCAESGWLVEVRVGTSGSPDRYAVGCATLTEAVQAVRTRAGIDRHHHVRVHRQLSTEEIDALGLRMGEIRWILSH